MSRYRKERRRPSLHMAPLIDCVLLLLIFFMLTATYVNRGIQVDLPAAAGGKAIQRGVMVTINRQGEIFLDGQPVTLSALQKQLAQKPEEDLEKILLKADQGVPFGRVVEVIGITRELGSGLSLITEPAGPSGDRE